MYSVKERGLCTVRWRILRSRECAFKFEKIHCKGRVRRKTAHLLWNPYNECNSAVEKRLGKESGSRLNEQNRATCPYRIASGLKEMRKSDLSQANYIEKDEFN